MALAAQSFQLKGTIIDDVTKETLPGANVLLENEEGKTMAGAVSRANGSFAINGLKNGSYKVLISFVGYRVYTKSIEVKDKSIDLPTIGLKPDAEMLDEVEVRDLLQRVVVKEDTLQYNADAYKTEANATAEDLIAKMPGMQVNNGEVNAQGEQVTKVLVDGEEFFTGDIKLALKNLPASIVEKIELIDGKTEESQFTGFDDGEVEKTINIVTKPGKNQGYFGKVNGGYGTDNRYIGGGNFNYFKEKERISALGLFNNINQQNFSYGDISDISSGISTVNFGGRSMMMTSSMAPGFNDLFVNESGGITTTNAGALNYSNKWGKKFKLSGSYFVNTNKSIALNNIDRQFFTDDDPYYRQEDSTISSSVTHKFSLRSEYNFTENTSVLFRPRGQMSTSEGRSISNASSGNALAGLQSTSLSDLQSELGAYSFGGDVFLRHKFKKEHRTISLRVDGNYGNTEGNSSLYADNDFIAQDSTFIQDQQTDLESLSYDIAFDLNYTEPIGEKSMLRFEYEPSVKKEFADQQTFRLDTLNDTYDALIPNLSTDFSSTYTVQNGGVGYSYRNGGTNISIRLNGEIAELEADQNYPQQAVVSRNFSNLLPGAVFRYRFEGGTRLGMFYRTRTSAPSLSQLQNNIDNSNPLQLSQGNPNLRQSYSHSATLFFNSSFKENTQNLHTRISIDATNNFIGTATWVAQGDSTEVDGISLPAGAQLSRPVNMDGYRSFRINSGYGLPLDFIKSNLDINANYSYRRNPGMLNGEENFNTNQSVGMSVRYNSNWSENFDFNISYYGDYNMVNNVLQPSRNNNYYNHTTRLGLDWTFAGGFVWRNSIRQTYYSGLSANVTPFYTLWNSSVGYKFGPNDAAEISVQVFDLLEENNSVSRRVSDTYLEDREGNVLTRYLMLNFTYNFRKFEGKHPDEMEENKRPRWRG